MRRLISSILLTVIVFSLFFVSSVNADGWVKPTGHEATEWGYPQYAYDGDSGSYAFSPMFGTNPLVLIRESVLCDKIRISLYKVGSLPYFVHVFRDGEWIQVYYGHASGFNMVLEFEQGTVSKMKVTPTGDWSMLLWHEADFWTIEAPPEKEWHDVVSWSFNLLTRKWTYVSSWDLNLVTRQWNTVLSWSFDPITKQWNPLTSLVFKILTLGWHRINLWFFSLYTTEMEVLFIGMMVCLAILFIIMLLALTEKKKED